MASRSPRSETVGTRTNRTCTCRSKTSPAGSNAERTLPMVFRNLQITPGNAWPWRDSRELRSGDLVRALGE